MKIVSFILVFVCECLMQAQHDHHSEPFVHSKTSDSGDIRSLDVYAVGGTLHVLTAEYEATTDASKLFYRFSSDDGASWSDPVRVDTNGAAPYARGRGTDFQLAAFEEKRVAIWLTKGSGFGGRGPLVAAHSDNGGKAWRISETPADDGTDGDHAFIDVTATPDGTFQAVWLDTRSGNGKGVLNAQSKDGGKTWSTNRTVDPISCECCWNVIQSDAEGNLYVLYRDKDPRDMAIGVSLDGGQSWKRLSTVGAFDWDFEGCPHAGGGLAIEGEKEDLRLHSLVWTGVEDHVGLYYLNTKKGEVDWSEPFMIGSDWAKAGDIAIDSSGRLVIVWTEEKAEGTWLRYVLSSDGGHRWSLPVQLSIPGNRPDHPRIVSQGGVFHVFWTENEGERTVWRTERID